MKDGLASRYQDNAAIIQIFSFLFFLNIIKFQRLGQRGACSYSIMYTTVICIHNTLIINGIPVIYHTVCRLLATVGYMIGFGCNYRTQRNKTTRVVKHRSLITINSK